MLKKTWMKVVLGLVGAFVIAQVVPYGRNHSNPPVTKEPAWPEGAKALAVRACYDCHSNQTEWPWYANVAPVSWLVQRDVDEGRHALNFSEWDKPQREADEAAKEVREGGMPMPIYPPLHPGARLSPDEKAKLVAALETIAGKGGGEHGEQGAPAGATGAKPEGEKAGHDEHEAGEHDEKGEKGEHHE